MYNLHNLYNLYNPQRKRKKASLEKIKRDRHISARAGGEEGWGGDRGALVPPKNKKTERFRARNWHNSGKNNSHEFYLHIKVILITPEFNINDYQFNLTSWLLFSLRKTKGIR